MANDVNANIRINIDSADALSQLRLLQTQISNFNKSVVQTNSAAVAKQRDLLATLQAQIGATKQFSTSIVNVESSVSRLGRAIDKNKLSLGEYFRYGVASSKRFGRVFSKEHTLMTQLATERVKKLQTQYVALGAAQNGVTKAMAIRPLQLFNADAAIAIQRAQLFNKLLRDGSTSLVNFGKNTQWAGRQLMVGFTVPLTIFGGAASKVFMDLEEQAINFRKVYGDIFTAEEEVEENLSAVKELSEEFTKYGIAAKDTLALAGVAAQSGQRGQELMEATTEATRLGVLGQMEQTEAMRTVITLQNAFKLSSEELTNSINFLNVVENQSVLSLQDVAGAIPRVAPVIYSLGGNVQDLAAMLVAMREGGVSAAEGANALKTSLSRLISPTAGAVSMAKELGIDLNAIVESNQGDIMGAVIQLAESMERLDGLAKQRLLSEVFGKRQYARVGALFNNITDSASQAQKVIGLTAMSTEELAETTERELAAVSDSISTKFTGAIERLKIQLAPIGELFLQIATPVIEFATKAVAKFNELSPGVRKFATIATVALGVVTPVLIMMVGLLANFIGNMVKGVSVALNFINRARGAGAAADYLSEEQLEATAAAASLEGRTETLTNALNVQRSSVLNLARAYQTYVASAAGAAAGLPRGFRGPVRRMAKGGMVGGQGNKDSEPALLMPGEFVMNKEATEKYGPILGAMNQGNIKGYADGSQFAHIGGGQKIGLVDLRSLMQGLPDAFSKGAQRFVNILAGTFGNAVKAIVLPSLGFSTSGSINRRMDRPGKSPVTREEFLADWDTRGLDRWSKSLDRAGLKMDDVQEDLTILDTAMRGQISSMEEGAVINDRVMKDIYDEASKTLPAQSRLRREFDRLSRTFKEVRVNLRKSMITKAGFATERVGKKEMAIIQGRRVKIGGDKAQFTKTGTGVTQAQLIRGGAVGSVLGESMDGGARTSVGAASPAKDGEKLVNDYVEGMERGAKANVPEARQSGAMVKGAFLSGAAGGAGIIGAAAIEAGGGEGGGGMGVIPMGAPLLGDDQPKGPRSDINTRKELPGDLDKAGEATDDLDKKGRRAGKGLMGLVMAMTMVAGSASMMEGKIGETAQSLFPLMMGLDALMIPLMLMGGGGGGGILSGVAGGLGAVGGAGAAAAAGIAAVVALIVAAVAAFAMAIKRSESFRQVFVDLFNTLKEAVSPFTRSMEELGEKSGSILGYISNLWNTAVGVVAANVSVVVKGIEIIVKILTMARNIFWGLIGVIINFVGSLGPVGAAIKNTFEGFRNFFANIPQLAREALLNVTKFIDKMVNNAIDGLNKLINAYNEVAERLGVDTIKPIENINLTVTVLQATGMRGSGSDVLANRELEKERARETARDSFRQEPLPETPEEPDPEGTGGSKEKSFLEKLKEDLAANAKLYLDAEKGIKGYMKNRGNFFGVFQKLRKKGVSEDIIAALGTGPEAIKNARELLKMGKKELKGLMKDVETVSVGQVVENARRQAIADEQKLRATRKTAGLSPELQEIILADAEMTKAFANTKKGTPEYERLMKVVNRLARAKKNLAEASKTEADRQQEAIDAIDESRKPILDEFERKEALFAQAFGNLERQWQPVIAANEKQIDLLQEQINAVQEEIDAVEKLNDADERRIRSLERQKEMLSRQIEALERQNEMDKRRIDQLNREDEMRNRVSEGLERELDIMSEQEDKIVDMYDKRFEALDKIAGVNDYIIDQQNKQVSLSRAIAEGDVYAATEAAMQMRESSAQFAQEQTRAGMESAMESQISGLRTAGGLSREQAEARIAEIQEQSYQTQLLVRDIEDQIYQRNLEMLPLKDQQYNLDKQIQTIQDVIYGRESQILDIQTSRLAPLESQLNAEQKSLANNQKALADAKAAVRIEGQTYDELQNQISAEKEAYDVAVALIQAGGDQRRSVENVRKKWVEVTNQIAAAVRTAKQLSETALMGAREKFDAIEMDAVQGRITPDVAEQRKAEARAAREAALSAINDARDAEISAALSAGTSALRMAAGGMIKKAKGYRGGGVVSGMSSLARGGFVLGDGARDSVPTMLTPGEFVVRKSMVKKYGKSMMTDLNLGSYNLPKYDTGKNVEARINSSATTNNINAPVYNSYDMNFNIESTNANADEIASKVMMKIKQVQGASVRRNRV